MTKSKYLKTFNFLTFKGNSKIDFDPELRIFSFKNRYRSLEELVHILYTDRIGVIENQDLYDDIDREKILALKNQGYLREIVLKEKKSKEPLVLLFSKNHAGDNVDKLNFEEKSPSMLKTYWQTIDKDEFERRQKDKHSNFTFLNKSMMGKKKNPNKTKDKRYRQEDNLWLWENKHLLGRIEEGL